MLEIRPNCENCGILLPNNSDKAMICSFECTYCQECVENVLFNVCPNCGGGLEKRPTRPNDLLAKYPSKIEKLTQLIDHEKFQTILAKYRNIEPRKR